MQHSPVGGLGIGLLSSLLTTPRLKCIPYSWKYWRELNLTVGSQIAILNVLVDLIWWLLKQIAKLPNLISHQIFRLYGRIHNTTTKYAFMAYYEEYYETIPLTKMVKQHIGSTDM